MLLSCNWQADGDYTSQGFLPADPYLPTHLIHGDFHHSQAKTRIGAPRLGANERLFEDVRKVFGADAAAETGDAK